MIHESSISWISLFFQLGNGRPTSYPYVKLGVIPMTHSILIPCFFSLLNCFNSCLTLQFRTSLTKNVRKHQALGVGNRPSTTECYWSSIFGSARESDQRKGEQPAEWQWGWLHGGTQAKACIICDLLPFMHYLRKLLLRRPGYGLRASDIPRPGVDSGYGTMVL